MANIALRPVNPADETLKTRFLGMSDHGTADLFRQPARKPSGRASFAGGGDLDRLPPHSPEAEQGVLGCILLSPVDCLPACVEAFKGTSHAFYDLRHASIYEAMVKEAAQNPAFDLILLSQRLKDLGQLESIGGLAYLSGLPDTVPSAANLPFYLGILKDKLLLRQVLHVCGEACQWVYESPEDVAGLLDKVERNVLLINQARVGATEIRMPQVIGKAHDRIQELHEKQGELTGIGSGYRSLDRKTNGFHGGEMIVVAARPSVGKTTFAMNVAEHVALEQNLPVGVFSLEMSAEQLGLRLLCSQAKIDLSSVRDGFLADGDFKRLTVASGRLAKAPIYIDETGGLTIMEIRAKARRMKQQYGIALFVIDYLQLCHSESTRVDNRQQEIADISHGIKELAKELNVPVIVLSQMNRDYERDNDKKKRKPRLSDLRESGAIEQDADFVGLLYKPKEDDEEEAGAVAGNGGPIQVNLLIAKHRNGPTGEVRLTFFKAYTRFESTAPIEETDLEPQADQHRR